jgi:hypothetical protein
MLIVYGLQLPCDLENNAEILARYTPAAMKPLGALSKILLRDELSLDPLVQCGTGPQGEILFTRKHVDEWAARCHCVLSGDGDGVRQVRIAWAQRLCRRAHDIPKSKKKHGDVKEYIMVYRCLP